MPSVSIKEERDGRREDFERLYKRFRRLVEKSGILAKCRRDAAYVPPSETRKIQIQQANKRLMKKLKTEQQAQHDRNNASRAIPAPLILFGEEPAVQSQDNQQVAQEKQA